MGLVCVFLLTGKFAKEDERMKDFHVCINDILHVDFFSDVTMKRAELYLFT